VCVFVCVCVCVRVRACVHRRCNFQVERVSERERERERERESVRVCIDAATSKRSNLFSLGVCEREKHLAALRPRIGRGRQQEYSS
jgi:hypothetical protein